MAGDYGDLDPDRADPADAENPQTALIWRTPEGVEHESWMVAYRQQERPVWWKQAVIFTLFRRWRCQAKWWCSWPATESGGTCDRHDARAVQTGRSES